MIAALVAAAALAAHPSPRLIERLWVQDGAEAARCAWNRTERGFRCIVQRQGWCYAVAVHGPQANGRYSIRVDYRWRQRHCPGVPQGPAA